MRKFNFRLERLLNYRRSLMARERVRFAVKVGDLVRAEEHADQLRETLAVTKEARIHSLEDGLTVREIENLHNHILRIGDAITSADEDIEQAKENLDQARVELVNRRRDERAIEMYRERKFKAWRKDYYRDENQILDDIGTIRHVWNAEHETD